MLGWAVRRTSAAPPSLLHRMLLDVNGAQQGLSDTTQPQLSPPPACREPGLSPRNSENPSGTSKADMGDPKEQVWGRTDLQHHDGDGAEPIKGLQPPPCSREPGEG